jgi:hypothetical protein
MMFSLFGKVSVPLMSLSIRFLQITDPSVCLLVSDGFLEISLCCTYSLHRGDEMHADMHAAHG